MTQPAVSNHLHALEERFAVTLLARGRQLRPTPAGVALAEHAQRVSERSLHWRRRWLATPLRAGGWSLGHLRRPQSC